MVLRVKKAFDLAMDGARDAYGQGDYGTAFEQLKRAHILGQRNLFRHWVSHWWMLKVGLRRHDGREITGQLVRLMAVLPGFVSGWVPVGNTGAAEVSALKPMPLPEDLEPVLGDFSVWNGILLRGLLGLALLLFLAVF